MLILFLKQTYHQKRNHIEVLVLVTHWKDPHHLSVALQVFAVTGPVMYTKCLVDSGMPISLAPQEWLYPAPCCIFCHFRAFAKLCALWWLGPGTSEAFHFVPNPDAINFSAFPKCLMRLGLAIMSTTERDSPFQ